MSRGVGHFRFLIHKKNVKEQISWFYESQLPKITPVTTEIPHMYFKKKLSMTH